MRNAVLAALTVVVATWATHPSIAQEADTASGERLFRQRCGACHQVATTRNGAGPHLQGVVGRAAGSVEGFNYSPALKASGITWTPETLETYLANPTAMVRGTRMVQRFDNADERRAIIAFLSSRAL
jgi:cytochrome c